jgi:alpha-D-ribose 1-methylphosphonate 5-triphosphate diphosphatase PhnM
MPSTLSAARLTNLASHPRATTDRHVLPRTRNLTAERQRHAVIVAGHDDTAHLNARRTGKAATIAVKPITSRRCVRANPKMWAAFTFNE